MNQEQDKEFDVLLRRYAKREGQRAKAALSFNKEGNGKKSVGFAESEHLDADAMSAYAENALPSAARLRYAEHLIGCDACRKVVTGLALTANPTGFVKEETTSVSTTTAAQTWREKLLSFLTIPSLKLAGSVAAVLFVATVTFIVWQRNDVTNDVATNQQPRPIGKDTAAYDSKGAVSQNENVNVASPTASASPQTQNTQQSKTAPGEPVSEKRADEPAKKSGENKDKDYQEAGSPSPEEDAPKDAKNDNMKTAAASQPAPPPGPVNAKGNSGPSATQNQVAQQEPIVAQKQNPAKGGPNRNSSRDVATERSQDRKSEDESNLDTSADKREEQKRKEAPRAKKAANDDDVALASNKPKTALETRSLGGKQFQRINNRWEDTAYKNSATTNIKRGSEEYNSLDASLRYISEQLGGVVIIVWNGKAYKIY